MALRLDVTQSLDAVPVGKQLLIGTAQGLMVWDPDSELQRVVEGVFLSKGLVMPDQKTAYFGSFGRGIVAFQRKEKQWEILGVFQALRATVSIWFMIRKGDGYGSRHARSRIGGTLRECP